MSLRRNAIPPVKSAAMATPASQGVRSWATVSGVGMALLVWNWQFAVALAIASVTGTVLYLGQERRLGVKRLRKSRTWKHHRSLWVGLSAGVGVFIGTYGTITVVQASESPWLTLAMIAQGMGSLALLGFLLWDKTRTRPSSSVSSTATRPRPFDEWLTDLTHPNAVNRLIAIRTVTRFVIRHAHQQRQVPNNHASDKHTVDDSIWPVADALGCFQLMQGSEPEPIVRQALGTAIEYLQKHHQQSKSSQEPVHTPVLPATPMQRIPNLVRTRKMVKAMMVKASEPLTVEAP
ncbi:MAG: hypothetical protein VKL39_01300 [Leptolyngbyaceae bacterium]|nr:hypothetical protein [Leptolyngbyaceae bacterium]